MFVGPIETDTLTSHNHAKMARDTAME